MKQFRFIGILLVLTFLSVGVSADEDPVPQTFFESLPSVGTIEEFGWEISLGSEKNAKMLGELDFGTFILEPVVGGAFLAISPDQVGGMIVYREILDINPGDKVEIDWSMFYTDTLPYLDSGYIYAEDINTAAVIPVVLTTILDGSSKGWNTSSFIASGDGPLWITVGALNGFDTAVAPIFMVGDVRINSAPAPVPIPAPMVLLGTAVAGLAAVRRRQAPPS